MKDRPPVTITGSRSLMEWDRIIRNSSGIDDAGRRVASHSEHFLGTAYEESTLIGDIVTPEVLVIKLGGVDCFTLLDYVEAMRSAVSFSSFRENLKRVRYRGGAVSYENRNHFFTDWSEYNPEHIEDVTEQIGGRMAIKEDKLLNKRSDGTCLLPGIPPVQRALSYIPSAVINSRILDELRTGDYAGIYSVTQGLDVSHAGIIIKDGDSVYLRHASSVADRRKVIDEDFMEYMQGKPGLIILRPK